MWPLGGEQTPEQELYWIRPLSLIDSQDQSEVREKPQSCDDDDDMSRIIRKEEHLKSSWLVESVMSSLRRF